MITKKELRKIFETMGAEVTRGWSNLHNEEINNLCHKIVTCPIAVAVCPKALVVFDS
jgi:hypothetical protein